MIKLINTVGYVGLLKPAPGTWGSAVAVPMAWGLHALGGFSLLAAATVLVSVLGLWSIGQALGKGHEDPPEIVIDEVAGQWLALWPVSLGAQRVGAEFWDLYPGVIAAFLAFRLFDIWKPGPVGWADRRGGATGVMLDDLIAGVFAALVVVALAAGAHGLMRL
jgi:phosphatidylglycerophosphatase A